jgi:hypothetical protein
MQSKVTGLLIFSEYTGEKEKDVCLGFFAANKKSQTG